MIKSFFTITIRNILRNRVYTLINILGLSMGVTVAILIFLIVSFDLDFDSFHSKKDRIFRVVHSTVASGVTDYHANIPYPAGNDLSQVVHGAELFTEIHQDDERMVEINNQKAFEEGILFVDSSFFKVFDFEIISGNPEESFKHQHTVFITESFATKHFGEGQVAIGKEIRLANLMDLEVTGIVKDPPASGHLQFQLLVSFPSLSEEYVGGFSIDTWGTSLSGYLYALLPENIEKEQIELQIAKFIDGRSEEGDPVSTYYLQPLSDVHFNLDYARFEFSPTVDISYLYILILTGFFIVLIASINFVNLSTALSVKRSKEVGIKKSLGAFKSHLIFQFLIETFLIVLVSILLSMGIVERLLPLINSFLEKELSFNLLSDPRIFLFLVGLLLVITLLAGLYPAFIISNYSPLKALRTKISSPNKKSISVRRFLVVFQFLISQALVIGSIIIISQLNYFQSKPLGFDKEGIVLMDVFERDSLSIQTLRERLSANPGISSITFGTGVPTSRNSLGTSMRLVKTDPNEFIRTRIKAVDSEYLNAFNLQLVAGEWLKESQTAQEGIVINEEAAIQLGFNSAQDAIGEFVRLGVNGLEGPVIGVVQNFHTRSLHRPIGPLALFPMHDLYFEAGIKIDMANSEETLAFILAQWEEIFPGYIYEYQFMDEMIGDMYQEEQKLLAMANIAALFSILIGCLGLYGLVSFMVIQKNKEIGIRKAIGASVGHIIYRFSREFMLLLTVSFLLAIPLVWYFMNQWLQSFAYQIEVTPWVFIAGYAGSIIIAGLTVGYKSYRAAIINPIDALKED